MNATQTSVHCVVVTPEKTELDANCDSLVLPLFDGELGILPGRAPMVGRLGFGLLKLTTSGNQDVWYVDGGFVQVTREAVYVLTDRLVRPDKLDRAQAESDLLNANSIKTNSPETESLKQRSVAQARAKLHLTK